jgi:hypothetical protein
MHLYGFYKAQVMGQLLSCLPLFDSDDIPTVQSGDCQLACCGSTVVVFDEEDNEASTLDKSKEKKHNNNNKNKQAKRSREQTPTHLHKVCCCFFERKEHS